MPFQRIRKTIIMISTTINTKIAQLSSKLQVNPVFWDVKTGKVKGRATEANNINRQLGNLNAMKVMQQLRKIFFSKDTRLNIPIISGISI